MIKQNNKERLDYAWLRYGLIGAQCKGRVLELNCESGDLITAVACFGHEVYGADTKQSNIERAKLKAQALGLTPRFVLWDGAKIALPSSSFDSVIISISQASPDPEGLIREARRLCRADSRLLVQYLNCTVRVKRKWQKFWKSQSEESGNISINWIKKDDIGWRLAIADIRDNLRQNDYITREQADGYFQEPLPVKPLDTSEKVSVIISTYNRAELLKESLESILNQTYPNTEVFVINDGSTDNTEDVLTPYFNRIIYLKKENGGKSSAVNFALRKATGKYVWIFDDDDIALPMKLELDVRAFQSDPDAGVTYSHGYKFEDDRDKIISSDIALAYEPRELFSKILLHGVFLNQTMVVKRACYDRVGLYREDLIRVEDWEMWIRLADCFKFHAVDTSTIFFRVHYGYRGSEKDRFLLDRKSDPSGRYGKIIFREIYNSFPLSKYCPELAKSPDDVNLQAEGLLMRMHVMIRHRLYDLLLNDFNRLEELIRLNKINLSFDAVDSILSLVYKSLHYGDYRIAFRIMCFIKRLSSAMSDIANIRKYTAKKIYWSARCNITDLNLMPGIKKTVMLLCFIFLSAGNLKIK
jgi:glycosyltransferase involved in cell wall biosynthesis/ubiquinone/menaquinone biosynthesis C-methylase UbiE